MTKTSTIRRTTEHNTDKSRTDAVPFRQMFDALQKNVPFAEGLVITTLPRGSLQIAQPPKLPEALMKDYAREFHLHDRLTWRAILSGKPIAAAEAWGNTTDAPF